MNKTSVLQLSQRLAEKQRSDQELAELASSKALAEHTETLKAESTRAVDSIKSGTDQLVKQVRAWENQITEAQRETAKVTASQIAVHQERLEQVTTEAQDKAKQALAKSVVPLALVWSLAGLGLLVLVASLFLSAYQAKKLMAQRAALERLQGVQVIERGGRTFIAHPRLSAVFQSQQMPGVLLVEINPINPEK